MTANIIVSLGLYKYTVILFSDRKAKYKYAFESSKHIPKANYSLLKTRIWEENGIWEKREIKTEVMESVFLFAFIQWLFNTNLLFFFLASKSINNVKLSTDF